jgi:hypothetical protein
VSCSDGQPASALRCGTTFTLSVQPPTRWPVTVDLDLDDRACSYKADLLTPLQTRQMLDSFAWPDPKLATPPLVAAETSLTSGDFEPDQVVTETGTFSSGGGGGLNVPVCNNVPASTFTTTDLQTGAGRYRFLTPVDPGVSFTLNVNTNAPPR